MLCTHFKNVISRQIFAGDAIEGDREVAILLIVFLELTCAPLFIPKILREAVHHAVLVVDSHAKLAIRRHGVYDKGTRRRGQHFFADFYIRAQRIPAGGVVEDFFVVALDAEISCRPALATHLHELLRCTRLPHLAQSV